MAFVDLVEDNEDSSNGSELDIVEQLTGNTQPDNKIEDDNPSSIPEKYKGKSVEDIVKMHQEAEKLIGKQAQEVGEVRKLADELLKQSLASKPQTPTEVEPEIDFFEDPQKAIRNTVDKHPDVLAARQATQEFKKMQIQQKLNQEHPDFSNIVQDPEFAEWVKQSPIRIGLYAKADSEFDYDSANELLSTYKQLKAIKTQQVKEAGNATLKQNLKAASVDSGGTGESSKRVYRRADLIRLRMNDPDRYAALEDEIMLAYSEGRVK